MVKRLCKECKEYHDKEKMIKVPLGWFCTFEHAIKYANRKSEERKERDIKARHRKKKQELKSLTVLKREAQTSVNSYIRARDYGKPCISCGNLPGQKRGGTMDAGHYRSVGAAPHLRYNLLNIHAQCVRCNRDLSGNTVEYRKRLIERIGIDKVEKIESDNEQKKYTREYLERLTKIFRRKARNESRRKNI